MIGKNDQGRLEDLADRLAQAMAASELALGLRSLSQAGRRLKAGRPLTQGERLCLENQGNTCSDWNRVRIESDEGLSFIRGNRFEGDVLLAGFKGTWPGPDGRPWPAGLSDCRVRDCIIGNASLSHIARLERQVIDEGAVLVGLGDVDCPAPTTFSLGRTIHPGAETGSRSVWLWDSLTLEDATAALAFGADAQKAFRIRLEILLGPLQSAFGFVGKGASVMHARLIHAAYIGPGARVSGASLIRESALLAAPGQPCVAAEDAWIEKSILQPGAKVESGGKVSQSFLMEGSEVGWGGMVCQSVIGPDTHIHKGEVTASLLGPVVGFHHQSLLISALWPEGRGNIAYGANVGSNHTGKKPDQEIRPGEGNFFGLGCSIKFPANYEDAPYSLIATGVSTAPQRVAFPFSLINQPQGGGPRADGPEAGGPGTGAPTGAGHGLNEIVPGWMWSDNAYALVRRMYKFESGSAASRRAPDDDAASTWKTGFFAGRLFSVGIAHKVLKAHQALRAAPPDWPFYLEDTLPGLGKNFLRGKGRAKALAAYEDYLAFFLMRAYADRPGEAWGMELSDLVAALRKELAHGQPSVPEARLWADAQRSRLSAFKTGMVASLARDDKRGRQVFDDYSDFHPAPEEDAAVARLAGDLEELGRRLEAFVKG